MLSISAAFSNETHSTDGCGIEKTFVAIIIIRNIFNGHGISMGSHLLFLRYWRK
jgi:hypothetical protein